MTYSAFVALVNEHLPVEATRRGTEVFRARMIRNALLDLQRFIRAYRKGHTTTYLSSNMEDVGCAQRAALPEGATPSALYIQKLELLSGPALSGWNYSVTSWAQLAALKTAGISKPYVVIWIDSTDGLEHTVQLIAGTDATDTASGIQRPDDFDLTSNAFVWYQVGSAG